MSAQTCSHCDDPAEALGLCTWHLNIELDAEATYDGYLEDDQWPDFHDDPNVEEVDFDFGTTDSDLYDIWSEEAPF